MNFMEKKQLNYSVKNCFGQLSQSIEEYDDMLRTKFVLLLCLGWNNKMVCFFQSDNSMVDWRIAYKTQRLENFENNDNNIKSTVNIHIK